VSDATSTVDHPFFARLWTIVSGHEPESLRRLRQENLAGLSGRVLEPAEILMSHETSIASI
jgi:hypothetical protein